MDEQEWFDVAVEQVAIAGKRACSAIEQAVRDLESSRNIQRQGKALAEIVDSLISGGGRGTRLKASEAFRDFERAIASMRAEVVRALVDREGLSLSDVAKLMQISRQAAGRLYHETATGDEDPGVL